MSKHVAVLMGGWSSERPVSLNSGQACADALEGQGFRVTRVDVIGPGALIWGRIVERVVGAGADDLVVSSEHDILDGVCLRLAGSVD